MQTTVLFSFNRSSQHLGFKCRNNSTTIGVRVNFAQELGLELSRSVSFPFEDSQNENSFLCSEDQIQRQHHKVKHVSQ